MSRSEDDEIEIVYPSFIGIGAAHAIPDDTPGDRPAGRLIVPDAESRTGWRDYYVPGAFRPASARPVGFRPPRLRPR